MMEERETKAKEIVDTIEREWAGVGEKTERREAALRDQVENERKAREEAEKRTEQLEEVLERMNRGDLPAPGPRSLDFTTDGMMGLSPTVAMVSKAQRSGKTFTEVYADYVKLQDDFAKKCAEYDRMDTTLSAVLAQIEERVCRRCYLRLRCLLSLARRHLFYRSNGRNTSASSQKHLIWLHNWHKPFPTVTLKRLLPRRTPRNCSALLERTKSFNNSSPTLAAKFRTSSAKLAAVTTHQSPRTPTLRCSPLHLLKPLMVLSPITLSCSNLLGNYRSRTRSC